MKVTTFDHVAVTVSDTERALEFYVGKLGLRLVENHQLEGDKVDEANGLRNARAQSTRLAAPDSPDILIDLLEYYAPPGETYITPMGSVGSCHFALGGRRPAGGGRRAQGEGGAVRLRSRQFRADRGFGQRLPSAWIPTAITWS